MRDHTGDLTPEEREAARRFARDITASMREHGPRLQMTPTRAARRAAARKQQRTSRKKNRR